MLATLFAVGALANSPELPLPFMLLSDKHTAAMKQELEKQIKIMEEMLLEVQQGRVAGPTITQSLREAIPMLHQLDKYRRKDQP